MLQQWQSLTFLHWRYQPETIEALLPRQVQLDTFDGSAWVALAPFVLSGLRLPFFPPAPFGSSFPETNVRTYVRGPDGERGVWFFTLEANSLFAVLAARTLYHLPYRWSRMRVRRTKKQVEYHSQRKSLFGKGSSHVVIEPGPLLQAGDFDNFLTARYRLYTVHLNRLLFAQIHHEPWRLQSARVIHCQQDLIQNSGVPRQTGDPVVHFSSDLAVRIGRLQHYIPS
jgi:uncharacterized protein YqjF (DUF2071 family)